MFMGGEFGQQREWSEARELDWPLLANPANAALHHLSGRPEPPYTATCRPCTARTSTSLGFEWIDCHDSEHSVLSWLRWGATAALSSSLQLHARSRNRLPPRRAGGRKYVELLNTDSAYYGGSNLGNGGAPAGSGGRVDGPAGQYRASPSRRWGRWCCAWVRGGSRHVSGIRSEVLNANKIAAGRNFSQRPSQIGWTSH